MPSTTQLIPTAEITINGTKLPRFGSVHLNQPFESHHTFDITLSPDMLPGRPAVIRLDELAHKFVGEPITIKFKQGQLVGGVVSGQQEQLFRGVVTEVRLSKTQSSTQSIILSGFSPTILLCAGETTRSFSDMSLKDMVGKLTDAVGLNSKIQPNITDPLLYSVQYKEDTYTFIQRLADFWGEWAYYDGETFIFGKDARPAATPVTMNLGTNLFDLDYSLKVTPLNSNWLAHNYKEDKMHEAESSAPVNGLQAYAKLAADKSAKLFDHDMPTQLAPGLHSGIINLQEIARRHKAKQAAQLAVLHGRTPEMELRVGSIIKVKEDIYAVINPALGAVKQDTIDYGQFMVTRLNHYADGAGYQATFEAVPWDGINPPVKYNLPLQITQPEIGVVKDVNDPQKMGLVKVQFPWQEKDNLTTWWTPVSHPMSGKEQGVYFIPEPGETVVVDYQWNDPSFPIVQSSLYWGDTKPGPLFNKDNNIKGIITRSGNHIIIDDESGKESIKIYNKDKKNSIELSLDGTHITIKSDGNINLQAGGDISMKAKNITMKAEKDWKTTADHAVINSDTGDVELSSGKELIMSAMTDVTLGATVELKAFGKIVKVTADATANVEASGPLTLKGGMVMIN